MSERNSGDVNLKMAPDGLGAAAGGAGDSESDSDSEFKKVAKQLGLTVFPIESLSHRPSISGLEKGGSAEKKGKLEARAFAASPPTK